MCSFRLGRFSAPAGADRQVGRQQLMNAEEVGFGVLGIDPEREMGARAASPRAPQDAIQREVSASADRSMSCPSIEGFGNIFRYSSFRAARLTSSFIPRERNHANPSILTGLSVALSVIVVPVAGQCRARPAPDKVSFGTNWVAEAEHGGFTRRWPTAPTAATASTCIVQGGPR